MLTLTLAVALSQAASTPVAVPPELAKGATEMTAAEIRAYNSRLDRNDPQYIRCKRLAVTGSLTRKATACRTNAEWVKTSDRGNEAARDFMDDVRQGQTIPQN